jgi:membrane-bound serine protease (ClpP class)
MLALVLHAAGVCAQPAERREADRTAALALVVDLEGPIGPAVKDHVVRAIATAQARRATLLVLRMDTPGGLDESTRDIVKAILASPVAVVTYVSPSGARAASAGAYILYASHVAGDGAGHERGRRDPGRRRRRSAARP